MVRQTRGIAPGLLDQEDVTYKAVGLLDFPIEGKNPIGGIQTTPISGEGNPGAPGGDPIVTQVNPDPDVPTGQQSREGAGQAPSIPGWLLILGAAVAFL